MTTLEDAILLAVQAHQGQKDKAGNPYILHPLRVMLSLTDQNPMKMMAAVLHDVVEDCNYTIENLRQLGYPPNVLDAIDHLTKREHESYEEFIHRVNANAIARQVKIADIEDNMDIRRLADIQQSDVDRLIRYRKAWELLSGFSR